MARDFIEALASNPTTIADARRSEKDGGVPDKPGVYAWWLASDVLPEVPTSPHPTEQGLRLLYIGIAPRYAESSETLRSRGLKKHAGSGLADSTLRRSLAALLWEENGWTPRLTPETSRFKLSPVDDAGLRAWQERNLRVSWVHVQQPWDIEAFAIGELEPPFNLAGNRDHPFYEEMNDARRRFKLTAEALACQSD